jgi:hypothetical protein
MRAKSLIFAIVAMLTALPAVARLSDFTGHWANTNHDGRIISLSITIKEYRVMVGAYAHCDSSYCNWDAAEALPYATAPASNLVEDATALYAIFKRPDSEVVLILSLPDGVSPLRVEEFTRFTNHSVRTDFATISKFVKDVAADGHTAPKDGGHTVADGNRFPRDVQHAKPPDDTIPQFPWPPPVASATDIIPRSLFPNSAAALLKDVDQRLAAALDACGYTGNSYYAVPKGFALVTHLEQINPDGTPRPMPGRWSAQVQPLSTFSLSEYLKALFTANPGRYRVTVLVVTSNAFSQTEAKVSKEEALGWLAKGLNQLPASIGNLPFTADYAVTALIYEFDEPHTGENAVFVNPSGLTGRDHLTKSKLLPTLEK